MLFAVAVVQVNTKIWNVIIFIIFIEHFYLQAFDAYVKEKTELERAEKKKRAKEAREKFQEMLKESDLHGK